MKWAMSSKHMSTRASSGSGRFNAPGDRTSPRVSRAGRQLLPWPAAVAASITRSRLKLPAGREPDRAFHLEGWNSNGSHTTDRIGRGTIYTPNLCESTFGGCHLLFNHGKLD